MGTDNRMQARIRATINREGRNSVLYGTSDSSSDQRDYYKSTTERNRPVMLY